jgi:hypothetical protein
MDTWVKVRYTQERLCLLGLPRFLYTLGVLGLRFS